MKHTLLLRRLFASLLLLAVSTLSWAYDFSRDGIYYKISGLNAIVTTGIKKYSGGVTIPSTVMYNSVVYNVTSIDSRTFVKCSNLDYVHIPSSVTSIGAEAFSGCFNLTSIIIPEGVTSIGENAFYGCTRIESISIPTSVVSIGKNAFSGCNRTSISVELGNKKYDSRNDCNAIIETKSNTLVVGCKNTNIPNSVTRIANSAFYACYGLTSITIPNNITSIGDSAFYNSRDLTSVTIGNSVTSIGVNAFCGNDLTSLSVALDNAKYDSRNDCNAIIETKSNTLVVGCKNTNIPNSVTSIGSSAFSDCTGLTSITIPNSVTSIGSSAFSGCTDLTSITIPNSVTSIGSSAFSCCTDLTSITIPNSVTSIGYGAFQSCPSLTSITIPNSVTSIGLYAFSRCSGLTSITIPESVTTIKEGTFDGCEGLTSVIIGNGVTTIDHSAFSSCIGLTSITIPNSVTSISGYAFSRCSGLTSILIGNGVKNIDDYAFANCSNLSEVTCLAKNVPATSSNSFSGVSLGTATLHVPASVYNKYKSASIWREFGSIEKIIPPATSIDLNKEEISISKIGKFRLVATVQSEDAVQEVTWTSSNPDVATVDKNGLVCGVSYGIATITATTTDGTNLSATCVVTVNNSLPSGVCGDDLKYTLYEDYRLVISGTGAMYNTQPWSDYCSEISSVMIENGVTTIGNEAFKSCSKLTSISIPNGVTSIGSSAFYGCSGLTSVNIPESVTSISYGAFDGCTGLTSITIPNNVTSIGSSAFYNCTGLTSITIPNSVTSIGASAFYGCKGLTSVIIGNAVTSIGSSAFSGCPKAEFYVNRGTDGLLSLWEYGIEPYEKGTSELLRKPSLTIESKTQATITYHVNNVHPGLEVRNKEYLVDDLGSNTYRIKGFRPDMNVSINVSIHSSKKSYPISGKTNTLSINPGVIKNVTASSLSCMGSYVKGDADVVSETISLNGKKISGNIIKLNGLNPETTCSYRYDVTVRYGQTEEFSYVYTKEGTLTTLPLTISTSLPKVISIGNIIVEAESNLDDSEENAGFEWRRLDWPDDFASNTGAAYLYEGTMEGYIRNLYAEKLWKYRPYYKSDSGSYYYGDWVGIDPTNTSYFEPTVHTYANISVVGNKVMVTGYVQRGSDAVKTQGFKYWVSESNAREATFAPVSATAVPRDAKTVEAEGRVMEADLTNLDYNTTYSYVAFVTTTEGETFYGKELSFTTGDDPMGIEEIPVGEQDSSFADEKNNENAPIYDLMGRRLQQKPKSGYYIRNGKKYFVK